MAPVGRVITSELPTLAMVERASWPEPPGVDLHHFNNRGLCRQSERGMSASPCPQGSANALDRTQGLSLNYWRGLVLRASIEPDERLSTHPALRENRIAAGKARALSLVGDQVYRVRFPI